MQKEKQKKGPTRQVRIRLDKVERVERIVVEEIGRRKTPLDNIDVFDEILEEGLSKREKRLGIA